MFFSLKIMKNYILVKTPYHPHPPPSLVLPLKRKSLAHSRLLVSIQRYFSVAINYVFIILHRAHSRLLVSIRRYFGSVLKNDDTSLFFTSINYHLKKTCVKILFLVYIHCLYIGKWYNSMYIFNNHFLHR